MDTPVPVHAPAPVVPALVLVVVGRDFSSPMSLFSWLHPGNEQAAPAKPDRGLYHFHWNEGEQSSRIHLRIDADDSGLLIVNANKVFHLNPSAALMAYYVLAKSSTIQAVKALSSRFSISKTTLQNDYIAYKDSLHRLIDDTACPICELELETTGPFTSTPSAPYRMDLALTYRCNNNCAHCYNARARNYPELTTQEWFRIIDHLWELGIPHIVFTGGEPTLRDDLPELIKHAEDNGQITGLNTNGIRLSDMTFVEQLVNAGLDHVQITMESHIPEIHDLMVNHKGALEQTVQGIRNVLQTRLYVMTNTTMLSHNSPYIPETLHYCNFDPIEQNLGVKGCTAALYNMCIEPNGDVIPCQSYYHPVGNLLKGRWEDIWNHELCLQLRERRNLPEKCTDCLIQSQCGGGCPLQFDDYKEGEESWRS